LIESAPYSDAGAGVWEGSEAAGSDMGQSAFSGPCGRPVWGPESMCWFV